MARPRRIGIVTTSFPRFDGDTAGSFVLNQAVAFRRLGFAVDAVVPAPPETADWGPDASWLEGIHVLPARYLLPTGAQRLFFGAGVPDNLSRRPSTALLIPPALAALTGTTARALPDWDAAISHWFLPSAYVVHAAKRLRGAAIPHLAIAHSGDVHLLSRRPLRPAARALPGTADFLGFISESLRDRYLALLPSASAAEIRPKTRITPMGIAPETLRASAPRDEIRTALGLSRFTVLFLGRMVPIKGLDLLIDAAAEIPDITLVAAGDGPERTGLERRAAQRGVDARFTGAVDAKKRAALLNACDVLVLPSVTLPDGRCEGLPLVLSEAMAAGLPVVAADTGSVKELVRDDENGLLFPEGNCASLTAAIRGIREHPKLSKRLSNEGKRTALLRDRLFLAQQLLPLVDLSAVPSSS